MTYSKLHPCQRDEKQSRYHRWIYLVEFEIWGESETFFRCIGAWFRGVRCIVSLIMGEIRLRFISFVITGCMEEQGHEGKLNGGWEEPIANWEKLRY